MSKIMMNIFQSFYCCGSYYKGNYGGVAQFDYHLKSLFNNRVFFQGPSQKSQLLEYLKKNPNTIVITDNHLSCDIPNEYKVFIVHHGCAITTAKRNPDWKEPWKSLCTNGQNKMLDFREHNNTEIISCSQSCINDFTKYFGDKYTKFKIHKLLHTSSCNLELKKTKFNTKNPIILGNWDYGKKGKHIVDKLKNINSKFRYLELNVKPKNGNIKKFIEDKQQVYLNSDLFLQISNSEGNAYSSLDALACGILVIATNVGLFQCDEDIPQDCYVK